MRIIIALFIYICIAFDLHSIERCGFWMRKAQMNEKINRKYQQQNIWMISCLNSICWAVSSKIFQRFDTVKHSKRIHFWIFVWIENDITSSKLYCGFRFHIFAVSRLIDYFHENYLQISNKNENDGENLLAILILKCKTILLCLMLHRNWFLLWHRNLFISKIRDITTSQWKVLLQRFCSHLFYLRYILFIKCVVQHISSKYLSFQACNWLNFLFPVAVCI